MGLFKTERVKITEIEDTVSYIDTSLDNGYKRDSNRFATSHVVGQYIYGLPYGTTGKNTKIIKIDTASNDVSYIDTTGDGYEPDSYRFRTSHVVGQYIYGLPNGTTGKNTKIIKIDTASNDAVSYIDTNVNRYEPGSERFRTSHVVGQYIYGLPYDTTMDLGASVVSAGTQIIRIDTASNDVSYIDTTVNGYEPDAFRFITSHVVGQYIYGLPFGKFLELGIYSDNTKIIKIDTAKTESFSIITKRDWKSIGATTGLGVVGGIAATKMIQNYRASNGTAPEITGEKVDSAL